MKKDRLIDIIGDIDEKFVAEAAPPSKRKLKGKKFTLSKWLGLAVGIAIIAGVCIALWLTGLNSNNDSYSSADKRWPEKIVYEGEVETNALGEIGYVPKWDEQTVSEQFSEFEYNSARYSTRVVEIDAENIGNPLGQVELKGYDIYTDTTYTAKGTIYEITDISSECAMALQFEGRTDYYVYVSSWYRPKTLGEFIDVLNLQETLSFGKAHYKFYTGDNDYVNIEFEDFDDRIVWDMLLSDRELENVYSDKEMYINVMSVSVDIPLLGYENISLGVTENGYLVTNILNTGKAFYIGEEKVQEFIDFIINNCQGYELVYVNNNQDQMSENEEAVEDMSYTEVYTNGYNPDGE